MNKIFKGNSLYILLIVLWVVAIIIFFCGKREKMEGQSLADAITDGAAKISDAADEEGASELEQKAAADTIVSLTDLATQIRAAGTSAGQAALLGVDEKTLAAADTELVAAQIGNIQNMLSMSDNVLKDPTLLTSNDAKAMQGTLTKTIEDAPKSVSEQGKKMASAVADKPPNAFMGSIKDMMDIMHLTYEKDVPDPANPGEMMKQTRPNTALLIVSVAAVAAAAEITNSGKAKATYCYVDGKKITLDDYQACNGDATLADLKAWGAKKKSLAGPPLNAADCSMTENINSTLAPMSCQDPTLLQDAVAGTTALAMSLASTGFAAFWDVLPAAVHYIVYGFGVLLVCGIFAKIYSLFRSRHQQIIMGRADALGFGEGGSSFVTLVIIMVVGLVLMGSVIGLVYLLQKPSRRPGFTKSPSSQSLLSYNFGAAANEDLCKYSKWVLTDNNGENVSICGIEPDNPSMTPSFAELITATSLYIYQPGCWCDPAGNCPAPGPATDTYYNCSGSPFGTTLPVYHLANLGGSKGISAILPGYDGSDSYEVNSDDINGNNFCCGTGCSSLKAGDNASFPRDSSGDFNMNHIVAGCNCSSKTVGSPLEWKIGIINTTTSGQTLGFTFLSGANEGTLNFNQKIIIASMVPDGNNIQCLSFNVNQSASPNPTCSGGVCLASVPPGSDSISSEIVWQIKDPQNLTSEQQSPVGSNPFIIAAAGQEGQGNFFLRRWWYGTVECNSATTSSSNMSYQWALRPSRNKDKTANIGCNTLTGCPKYLGSMAC